METLEVVYTKSSSISDDGIPKHILECVTRIGNENAHSSAYEWCKDMDKQFSGEFSIY